MMNVHPVMRSQLSPFVSPAYARYRVHCEYNGESFVENVPGFSENHAIDIARKNVSRVNFCRPNQVRVLRVDVV